MAKRKSVAELKPTHTYKSQPVEFISKAFVGSDGKQYCTILEKNKYSNLQRHVVLESKITPIDFYCPCGCDGDAEHCVYAAKCPKCGEKFYGGHGYADRETPCPECNGKVQS